VLLTNRIALILMVLSILLAFSGFYSLDDPLGPQLILGTSLFYVVILLLNYAGFKNASRLILSFFVPLATFLVAILIKQNSVIIDEMQFFSSRIVLLFSAIIPLTLFLLREHRLLALALSPSLLSLILYDPIHDALGLGYFQLGYTSINYNFLDYLMVILYALIVSAFLYYKLMLERAEMELTTGNKTLIQLYQELGRRHEEIGTQAEKLTESQQQLQEANQLIEQQKALLEAENIQLQEHLLEKNKILEASNQELHSRIEELRQFSYTISHNLRGPVASLLGLTSLFNLQAATPENRELLLHAQTAARALDTVIRDLSQVLQIREGKLAMERIDLPHLIENVLLSLRKEQDDCSTTIEQHLEISELKGVKSYLHSILYNLLSNAIKYRHPERNCQISVRCVQQDKGVLLEIIDNGMGIDLQQHGHNLFKMYKRFHENREGRGLGLYLIKVQAEILGGYIEVQSQPGVGTTFSVWLPQEEHEQVAAP
jgi:signal transduction histidine kinase